MRIFSLPGKLVRLITRFLLPNAILLGIAFLFVYLGQFRVLKIVTFCPLHLFGIYCPTCGMTRAARALLELDLAASLRYHPLLPLFLVMVLYYEWVHLRAVLSGRPARRPRHLLMFTIAAFVAFFVLRNVLLLVFGIDPVGDFIK